MHTCLGNKVQVGKAFVLTSNYFYLLKKQLAMLNGLQIVLCIWTSLEKKCLGGVYLFLNISHLGLAGRELVFQLLWLPSTEVKGAKEAESAN